MTHICGCGCELDRDTNAAINILKIGLRTVGHTGTAISKMDKAWGENANTLIEAMLSGQAVSVNQESPGFRPGECQDQTKSNQVKQ